MFSASTLKRDETTVPPVTTLTGPPTFCGVTAVSHQSSATMPGAPPVGAVRNPVTALVVPNVIAGVPPEVSVDVQNAVIRSTNTRPVIVKTLCAATVPDAALKT